MKRVSMRLARGIVVAAFLLWGAKLGDSSLTPLQKTLSYLRAQDFSPLFQAARGRVEAHAGVVQEVRRGVGRLAAEPRTERSGVSGVHDSDLALRAAPVGPYHGSPWGTLPILLAFRSRPE